MAKVVNAFVKFIGYIGIFLFVGFQSFIVGLFLGGAGISLVATVWSIIRPLPVLFTERFWLIYVIAGAVIGTAVGIYTAVKALHSDSKKHNKQDN